MPLDKDIVGEAEVIGYVIDANGRRVRILRVIRNLFQVGLVIRVNVSVTWGTSFRLDLSLM